MNISHIETEHKKYKTDNHLIYSCQYHVIFCPKYRRNVLKNGIDSRLKELIKEIEQKYQFNCLSVEIMPDHVHLLISCNPKIGIYKIITKIKGYTSNTLRKEFKELRTKLPTLWTRNKFISSVGTVSLETVMEYIKNQKYV